MGIRDDLWRYSDFVANELKIGDPRGLGPVLTGLATIAEEFGLQKPVERARLKGKAIMRLHPDFKSAAKTALASGATARPQ